MSDTPDRPRPRQASLPYLPPPPTAEEDLQEVRVPRAEPPPASLHRMMRGRTGALVSPLGVVVRAVLAALAVSVLAGVVYFCWLR